MKCSSCHVLLLALDQLRGTRRLENVTNVLHKHTDSLLNDVKARYFLCTTTNCSYNFVLCTSLYYKIVAHLVSAFHDAKNNKTVVID